MLVLTGLCFLLCASHAAHPLHLLVFSWRCILLGEPHPRRQADHITNLICHGDVKQMAGLGGSEKRDCASHTFANRLLR